MTVKFLKLKKIDFLRLLVREESKDIKIIKIIRINCFKTRVLLSHFIFFLFNFHFTIIKLNVNNVCNKGDRPFQELSSDSIKKHIILLSVSYYFSI